MTDYQLPMPKLSSAYLDLIDEDNNLVNYFRLINLYNIHPVVEKCYSYTGPQGYGIGLFLSRMLKVKQTFISDRILARRLSKTAPIGSCVSLIKALLQLITHITR